MPWTLAAAALVHLATAAVFFAVGARLGRRPVEGPSRGPHQAFVAWWSGFGAYLAGQGALDALAAAGWTPLWPSVAFRLLTGPLLGLAAGGLAHYIVFLWSGRSFAVPIAFYYGAAAGAYSVSAWLHGPEAVAASAWGADIVYARPMDGPLLAIVLASFGLPLVLGSVAYLGLLPKVHDRAQRYRIWLVGTSILVWVASGYAAEVAGGPALRFVAIVVLGLATAGAVLAAYYPPAGVRRWLGHAGRPP